MPISGIANLPVAPVRNQRQDVVERVPRIDERDTERNDALRDRQQLPENPEVTASEPVRQQQVEAPTATAELFSRNRAEDEDLPLSTRRALETFAENTPSAEQQLGIQLAGIDTFA